MPESPIRKLAKYADAAKRNGVHIYHLNIGQPDIKTPACAMDALQNFKQEILEYSPSQGIKSLRTKMVGYYAEYGIDLSPDEIIITSFFFNYFKGRIQRLKIFKCFENSCIKDFYF